MKVVPEGADIHTAKSQLRPVDINSWSLKQRQMTSTTPSIFAHTGSSVQSVDGLITYYSNEEAFFKQTTIYLRTDNIRQVLIES